jgi:hypothetical protein
MTLKFTALIFGLMVSANAMAQDYGLTLGVHQTTATVDTGTSAASFPAGSVSGRLNFDLGLTASFELVPNFRFRSGVLYDTRAFDYKLANGAGTFSFNYAYVDVPVNVQYNFTPMVGIYGGLIVGIKASDSKTTPTGFVYDGSMKSMYPLVNLGVNFMFNNMFGFDLYGEDGLGEFADHMKNYQTIGMHFIYWL